MKLAVMWFVLLLQLRHANSVEGQAPGDGDELCTEETLDGIPNPFFAIHPVYSASERPLMDSRDYNRLLQESGNAYIPWQSVDRDNSNTGDVVTEVNTLCSLSSLSNNMLLCSGLNWGYLHVKGQ